MKKLFLLFAALFAVGCAMGQPVYSPTPLGARLVIITNAAQGRLLLGIVDTNGTVALYVPDGTTIQTNGSGQMSVVGFLRNTNDVGWNLRIKGDTNALYGTSLQGKILVYGDTDTAATNLVMQFDPGVWVKILAGARVFSVDAPTYLNAGVAGPLTWSGVAYGNGEGITNLQGNFISFLDTNGTVLPDLPFVLASNGTATALSLIGTTTLGGVRGHSGGG